MASAKTSTIATWTLSALLAVSFVMSGISKLLNAKNGAGIAFSDQFIAWGYPAWFRFVVGVPEAALGALLLVPAVRFWASTGLVVIMIGAVATHLRIGEYAVAPAPLVLGLLAALVAYLSRPEQLPFARRASPSTE